MKITDDKKKLIKDLIEEYEQLSPEELLQLNSKLISLDNGKIPISSTINIYLDLSIIQNIELGIIIFNLFKNNQLQQYKDILRNNIKQFNQQSYYNDINILLNSLPDTIQNYINMKSYTSNDLDNEYIHCPYTSGLQLFNYITSIIEPTWTIDTQDKKYINLYINTYPYIFNDLTLKFIEYTIFTFTKINNIVFIKENYETFFNKKIIDKIDIFFINNIKKLLDIQEINSYIGTFNEKTISFPMSDKYIFTPRNTIFTKEIINDKYLNNEERIEQELKAFVAYMNIFSVFYLFDNKIQIKE